MFLLFLMFSLLDFIVLIFPFPLNYELGAHISLLLFFVFDEKLPVFPLEFKFLVHCRRNFKQLRSLVEDILAAVREQRRQ